MLHFSVFLFDLLYIILVALIYSIANLQAKMSPNDHVTILSINNLQFDFYHCHYLSETKLNWEQQFIGRAS